MGPRKCERYHGHEQLQLGGPRQPGIFHVEAAGLGVAEQAFDLPALSIEGKSGLRRAIGGQNDHGSVVAALCDERHRAGVCGVHAGKASLVIGQLATRSLSLCQGAKRGVAAIIKDDSEVLLDPYGERDLVGQQELKPAVSDELPASEQNVDRPRSECVQIAHHQRRAVGSAAGAGSKHVPQDGNAHPARSDAQHQEVDVLRADLPVGPVETQRERSAQVQKPDQGSGKPCLVKLHELKEALQAAIV